MKHKRHQNLKVLSSKVKKFAALDVVSALTNNESKKRFIEITKVLSSKGWRNTSRGLTLTLGPKSAWLIPFNTGVVVNTDQQQWLTHNFDLTKQPADMALDIDAEVRELLREVVDTDTTPELNYNTPAEKKERLEEIKKELYPKGWKASFLYGLLLKIGDDTAWLTFSLDNVLISTSLTKTVKYEFGDNPAKYLAEHIDSAARHFLGSRDTTKPKPKVDPAKQEILDFDPAEPKQTFTNQVAKLLKANGFNVTVEDTLIKSTISVPQSQLKTILSINFDVLGYNYEGDGIVSYAFRGVKNTVLYPFEIKRTDTVNPEKLAAFILQLSKRAFQRVLDLENLKIEEESREAELERKRAQELERIKKEEEDYALFKQKMLEKVKLVDKEKEFAERFKRENPDLELPGLDFSRKRVRVPPAAGKEPKKRRKKETVE
jgi:hypothetical protein